METTQVESCQTSASMEPISKDQIFERVRKFILVALSKDDDGSYLVKAEDVLETYEGFGRNQLLDVVFQIEQSFRLALIFKSERDSFKTVQDIVDYVYVHQPNPAVPTVVS